VRREHERALDATNHWQVSRRVRRRRSTRAARQRRIASGIGSSRPHRWIGGNDARNLDWPGGIGAYIADMNRLGTFTNRA